MLRNLCVCVAGLLAVSAPAASGMIVSVGNYTANPGDQITINIAVSGGEQLYDMFLGVMFNDGPPDIGGNTLVPVFTGYSFDGTIWDSLIVVDPPPLTPPSSAIYVQAFSGSQNITRAANGLLVRLFADTTGAAPGVYAINFDTVNSVFNSGSAMIPEFVTYVPGMLTITPEPAAVTLLALGLCFLRRR